MSDIMDSDNLISQKKPAYPVSKELEDYLLRYKRKIEIPILYEDLLRFQGSVVVYDIHEKDTLWIRVYYSQFDTEEIHLGLKKVYSILYSDGGDEIIQYLNIDAIDYCTFGNSKPFRVKVRNVLNDNFSYFYVKKTDASRIYGLELEHILSPYHLNFLVFKDTLIEEHIAGIPGDVFITENLENCSDPEKAQIAKEFVKFNERCLVRLLGDMRSYNYVITPIHDFDHVVYKIRAIDFDQQSFEGRLRVYLPQFFKENYPMVQLVEKYLAESSIEQYKVEERSIVAKRILSNQMRINGLVDCMKKDQISLPEKEIHLKTDIFKFTRDIRFKNSKTMGEILENVLDFVRRNYEEVKMN